MKIRTIITVAAAGLILSIAGGSLAFADEWVCPRGSGDCQGYEYCTTHDHGDCDGQWNEDGSWVCPDGTHNWSASSGSNGPSGNARGYGHHRGRGCGSHHR